MNLTQFSKINVRFKSCSLISNLCMIILIVDYKFDLSNCQNPCQGFVKISFKNMVKLLVKISQTSKMDFFI